MSDRSILMSCICIVMAPISFWKFDVVISSIWVAALVVIYANSKEGQKNGKD